MWKHIDMSLFTAMAEEEVKYYCLQIYILYVYIVFNDLYCIL